MKTLIPRLGQNHAVRVLIELSLSPITVFSVWAIWLASPFLMFGSSSYVKIVDTADSLLSSRLAIPQLIASGQLGYWNAQSISGVDRLGTAFTGDLEQLLYLILPGWLAYGLFMLLQRFISGYFIYLLLRKQFDVGYIPAILSGLTYSFYPQSWHIEQWSGYAVFDNLLIPGIPLILYCLSRVAALTLMKAVFGAIILGSLIALNSSYPFAVFALLLMPYWLLVVERVSITKLTVVMIFILAGWLFSELPFWASLFNAGDSQRTVVVSRPEMMTWAHRQYLITGIISANWLPIISTLPAIVWSLRRDTRLQWLLLWISVSFAVVLFYPILIKLQEEFNIKIAFTADRVSLLLPFLLTVTGALGFNALFARGKSWALMLVGSNGQTYSVSANRAFSLMAIGWVLVASLLTRRLMLAERIGGNRFDSFYSNAELLQLRQRTSANPPFRVVTVPGYYTSAPDGQTRLLHPAYAMAYGFETADGYEPLYTKRYHDFWQVVISNIAEPMNIPYFHLWGNRVYLFKGSNITTNAPEFFSIQSQEAVNLGDRFNHNLLSLANVRYFISPFPLTGNYLKPYVLHNTSANSKEESDIPISVYENPEVLSRYFLAHSYKLFDTDTALLNALGQSSIVELAKTAFLKQEETDEIPLSRLAGGEGRVVPLQVSSDRIVLTVNTTAPTILVLTNNYNKFWRVTVNGISKKVFPVYHTFQGVYIEPGDSHVTFDYYPPYRIIAR